MTISADASVGQGVRQRVHGHGTGPVALRRFPYPYRAALAICSDIDDTKNTDDFLELHRFLNTQRTTSMGQGLGLEIADSVYFYDDDGYFSYFTHNARARAVIEELIRAGYIDCLHSYGDANLRRDEILRSLDALDRAGCWLNVWVNHNGGMSNLSRKFAYMFDRNPCLGAIPGSAVYHTDATIAYGIRFAWVGACTRIVGQEPGRRSALTRLGSVVDQRQPLHSAASVLKEARKSILGSRGDERFVLHHQNELIRTLQLEDGQRIHEFIRYCDHPRGIPYGGTAHGLARQIGRRVLDTLTASGGFMIVYTHLGQSRDPRYLLPPETQSALRGLAIAYHSGAIYVTTTSRLLQYYLAYTRLVWSYRVENEQTIIDIEQIDDPVFGRQTPTLERLQGLTFYVPDCQRTEILLQGAAVTGVVRNLADERGRQSVSIPRIRLMFPF